MAELDRLLRRSNKLHQDIQKEQRKDKPDYSKLERLEKDYETVQDQIDKIAKGR